MPTYLTSYELSQTDVDPDLHYTRICSKCNTDLLYLGIHAHQTAPCPKCGSLLDADPIAYGNHRLAPPNPTFYRLAPPNPELFRIDYSAIACAVIFFAGLFFAGAANNERIIFGAIGIIIIERFRHYLAVIARCNIRRERQHHVDLVNSRIPPQPADPEQPPSPTH